MGVQLPNIEEDNDIVISGMSGMFPNCHNIKEFENNLYNKVCMVDDKETRWKHMDPTIPRYLGKLPDLRHFDATFFGVHLAQADKIDPQQRILIQEAYKAILDAGVNPSAIRGSRTGVYIGGCLNESDKAIMYSLDSVDGFAVTGCCRAMSANRVSYLLGLNGPSFYCDTACSSSIYALSLAYKDFRNGSIDAAIVGGVNLCLHPAVTKQFALLGVLSKTRFCTPFDASADGYNRSEAVAAVFLQRKKDAKRIYGTLVHCATNCDGYKPEGITFPSSEVQKQLLTEVYEDANLDVNELGYLEAHATGTAVGDPEECKAIELAICNKRTEPLLVGSVKSNCGHSESASGLCSIVKVCLAMRNNSIPPNINIKHLRTKDIPALRSGSLKVVMEQTALPKPYVGLNSFGFGGANAHAVLKQHVNRKEVTRKQNNKEIPRLVLWSGRTEKAIIAFLDDLEERPLNEEYLALVQSAQTGGIQGMMFRGYNVLESSDSNSKPKSIGREHHHTDGIKPPLIWVFAGMGSQWVGMGKSLMQLPVFSKSIQVSHDVLKPLGVNLIDIICGDDPKTFENILNSFVGITAIQIALVDVLNTLNIVPDHIIGHSVGELGCAYADGTLTAEQTILSSYYRGKVSLEVEKVKGAMAAIGLGYKDIKPLLPASIDAACHNSSESTTVSGPLDAITAFVNQLKAKNVFAKEVPCSNIAYHSRYIEQFGSALLHYMSKVIPAPLPRSKKWISTSVPEAEWHKPESQLSSALYHTNNLLHSVLFEEAMAHLPKNSIAMEIAPHALLQSIVKTGLPNTTYIGLTRRNSENNLLNLLQALGRLYMSGVEVPVDRLYPAVQWPVSGDTPSISHLVEFDQSHEYYVYIFDGSTESSTSVYTLNDDTFGFLRGHDIDGRVLVPATFYLDSVWRTFAKMRGIMHYKSLAVEFENVKFVRATTFPPNGTVDLTVCVQKSSGKFEITESNSLVAFGVIRSYKRKSKPALLKSPPPKDETRMVAKADFYKELKLRGYYYKNDFQAVETALDDGSYGRVRWDDNWVTFMDCMLQLHILGYDTRGLVLPTKIRLLRISPEDHIYNINDTVEVFASKLKNTIVSGGIEAIGLSVNGVNRRKTPGKPILESYEFVPNNLKLKLSLTDIARCCIQLLLENQTSTQLQVLEIAAQQTDTTFLSKVIEAIDDLPLITASCSVLHQSPRDVTAKLDLPNVPQLFAEDDDKGLQADILIKEGMEFDEQAAALAQSARCVILKVGKTTQASNLVVPKKFVKVGFFTTAQQNFALLMQLQSNEANMKVLKVPSDNTFKWVEELQRLLKQTDNIVLVSQGDNGTGLLGLVNCLRREPETKNIRGVVILDENAPAFDAQKALFKDQLKQGLAINVYKNATWGTYRHLLLKPESTAKSRPDHIYANIMQIGDMSSLKWLDGPLRPSETEVRVMYSSLNFKDIMLASGRLALQDLSKSRVEQTCIFGFEYSGINLSTGRPIMGMTHVGAVSSHIKEAMALTWDVPEGWSLRDAATVPVVYVTVYYAFFHHCDIRNGRSILIHAGSGGIGIAAIRVALAYGLEVFTTVSTQEKKNYLLHTFPALKEDHIGNSRDSSFEDMVLEQTNGSGVDFVLNSLSEDLLRASIRCLAKGGHFLEIGKFDMANDNELGMGEFLKELTFHAVLADNLLNHDHDGKFIKSLRDQISKDIASGIIQPLPSTAFMAPQVEDAFRFLMSGKHIGKVLIQLRSEPQSLDTVPIVVVKQTYFLPELVYVVPGGLGGFGLELVDWMILRGARKIVLSSSRGITNHYQKLRISIWKNYNCQILINTSDISTSAGSLELLTAASKLGPIGGIFNLAVLLRDAVFKNQTPELFLQSFRPKALATKYLDEHSRKLCPKLQHFVIFSSVSCGRGNAGQTNYGMANSVMERIIERRVANGLPGKAIQWGAVGEVGLVADMAAGKIDLEIGGTLQQRINSCIEVLDQLLSTPDPIVASMVIADKRATTTKQSPIDFLLKIMGIKDLKSVPMAATLAELGMDSLMGMEIQQGLERDFDVSLNVADLRSLTFPTFIEIAQNATAGSEKNVIDATVSEELPEFLRILYESLVFKVLSNKIFEPINNVRQGPPIIIFSGLEGCSGIQWQKLGSGLHYPAFVLQLHNNELNTLEEMITFAHQNIVKFLREKGAKTLQIIGFSYGTVLAHGTLKLLERDGYRGKAIFIDGSPKWIRDTISIFKLLSDQKELTKLTVAHILEKILNIPATNIDTELPLARVDQHWEEYMRRLLQKGNVKNIDILIRIIKQLLLKISLVPTIKDEEPPETELLLVRPTKMPQYIEGKTLGLEEGRQVKIIDGNHITMLQNEKLPALINEYFH